MGGASVPMGCCKWSRNLKRHHVLNHPCWSIFGTDTTLSIVLAHPSLKPCIQAASALMQRVNTRSVRIVWKQINHLKAPVITCIQRTNHQSVWIYFDFILVKKSWSSSGISFRRLPFCLRRHETLQNHWIALGVPVSWLPPMIGLHQVVWRSLLSMFAPHRKVILSYWQLVMTGHGFESYTSLLASSNSENAQCFGSTVSAIEAGWTVSMSPNVSKTYPNSPLRILFVSPSQLCSDHIDQNGNVFAPVRGLSESERSGSVSGVRAVPEGGNQWIWEEYMVHLDIAL